HLAQGINRVYVLPAAAAALSSHIKNGYVDRSAALPAILAGLATAGLCAWAASGLDTGLLRRCFGGFLLVVGLRELFHRRPPTAR
uniref:TSUP family transporter n=1 Tax=Intestinimonas timonensis TaxID=1689270 RepID=UPI003A8F2201